LNFQPDQLISLTAEIFAAAGCECDEARRVGVRLVESNLTGHDSHGVIRIPSYVEWLGAGKVLANQSLRVVSENEAIVVVDGQFGLGQTVGGEAMKLGIEKASGHGVSVVALRNAGHLGRIGDWAEMATEAGMISLHFVNTSGAGMMVAPFGGIDRRLSVNPIVVGIPAGEGEPIILDMSGCAVAEGKVRVALNQGESLPQGCLMDSEGNPTDAPELFYGDPPGSILPIAGHKGSGLLFVIELLAGALTGGSCSNPANASRVANGMLSVIIDRSFFGSAGEFFPEVARFVDFVKSSRTMDEHGEILLPGEPERRTKAARMRNGIELDDVTWTQICATCRSLGVEHGFDEPDPSEDVSRVERVSIPGCETNSLGRGEEAEEA